MSPMQDDPNEVFKLIAWVLAFILIAALIIYFV